MHQRQYLQRQIKRRAQKKDHQKERIMILEKNVRQRIQGVHRPQTLRRLKQNLSPQTTS